MKKIAMDRPRKCGCRVSRRSAITSVAATLLAGRQAFASTGTFPDRPITLMLGVPPGGSLDVQVRVLTQILAKQLGQPVVQMYRPGVSATLAPTVMAQTAAPDGYTISILPTTLFRLPHLQKVTFDPIKDFTYIINVASQSFGLVVEANSKWKSFPDLLAYAKAHPSELSYGTQGAGGATNINVEKIARAAGVKLNFIPYKGAAEVWQALMGGHIDMAVDTGFAATLDSGRGRLLAVMSESRTKKWPTVSTVKELGFDATARGGWGIAGPKGMDPAVVKILHDVIKKAMDDPAFLLTVEQQDQELVYMDSKTYSQWAVQQFATEKRVLSDLGFKLE